MVKALLGIAGAILTTSLVTGTPAQAADQDKLSVSHVEPAGEEVQILVSMPADSAAPDLDNVSVTLNGVAAEAEAAPAELAKEEVRRTTILAIDTSDSMQANGRFAAAKAAANTFLDSIPNDVYVGIVTFDATVETPLEPTTDRAKAKAVVADLDLARGTFLNEGVIQAAKVAGTDGQRSILVLSDGLDTSKTPVTAAEAAIEEAEVNVDVVALDQSGSDLVPLQAMSAAGEGAVIPADPAALTAAFTAEADILARQILVTAEIPEAVSKAEATVQVSVPTGRETLTAQTFSIIRSVDEPGPDVPRAAADDVLQIPKVAMYGGLAAVGLGILLLVGTLMVMATARPGPTTLEGRIAAYASDASTGSPVNGAGGLNLDQAKNAAASMLKRNKGLEARIEHRLEAAGSHLKSSEWLLMHSAITILAGMLGLLLTGGSFVLTLLFVAGGVVVPWLWLGRKKRKRIKAFNAGLADTLQLMAGSLTAGMSLAQSIDTVVKEGTEPIAGEFQRALIETRLGVSLVDALEGIAARTGSKDFAWVVMAIKIQRDVGGNLAELLTTVAGTLRERDYLRRQVHTLSAEGRLSAYILGGLPPAMAVYMLLVRGDYIRPLYTDPRGWLMIAAAVTLLGVAGWLMSRIVKVEV
jgi:tight adherence protein B